jgi:hypothetical protein
MRTIQLIWAETGLMNELTSDTKEDWRDLRINQQQYKYYLLCFFTWLQLTFLHHQSRLLLASSFEKLNEQFLLKLRQFICWFITMTKNCDCLYVLKHDCKILWFNMLHRVILFCNWLTPLPKKKLKIVYLAK